MQTRAKWLALLAVITLSACGTTRRNAAELDTSRPEPRQAPAPQYPYTWRPRQLPREPACYDAAMCYDEKREVCVLHGGRSWWWDARGSTWIWDGEKWRCEDQPMYNIYAHSHAMTYRHETEAPLMWGGGLDHPYTMWSQWSPMTDCRSDQSPDRLTLASDPLRNVVVAFGGLGSERKELRTLYEIHDDSMKQVTFESGPSAQYNALLVYEPSLRACLLVDHIAAEDGKAIRTWTWDGLIWNERLTQGPESTIRGADFLLYDTSRQCAVAICPGADSGPYELWELKGSEWIKRITTGAPAYRQGASAAYDKKRKTIVLHGGQMHLSNIFARDETWLCDDKGVWRCANSPPAPRPDLNCSCMCYDPSRKGTVLIDESYESWSTGKVPVHLREWLWNGSRWLMQELPAEMPRYCRKTAVFDKRRIVMYVWFEGEKTSELWQCAQGVWSKSKRGAIALPILGCVYNDALGLVMLFHDDPKGPDNETRISAYSTWDGETIRTHETRGPKLDSNRNCVAYDRARNCVAGIGMWEDPYQGATWEFDGSTWFKHVLPVSPRGWSCEAFSYLGAVNRCVLFGGGAPMASDQHYVQEHWQWDGQKWECLQFANAPPGRCLALMAEDTDRGCLVLFGGVAYRRQYCDTWEYGPDKP